MMYESQSDEVAVLSVGGQFPLDHASLDVVENSSNHEASEYKEQVVGVAGRLANGRDLRSSVETRVVNGRCLSNCVRN